MEVKRYYELGTLLPQIPPVCHSENVRMTSGPHDTPNLTKNIRFFPESTKWIVASLGCASSDHIPISALVNDKWRAIFRRAAQLVISRQASCSGLDVFSPACEGNVSRILSGINSILDASRFNGGLLSIVNSSTTDSLVLETVTLLLRRIKEVSSYSWGISVPKKNDTALDEAHATLW